MSRYSSLLLRVTLVTLFLLGVLGQEAFSQDRGEPITFQAEVEKILHILVNSLYTNRDIFLRELISNGSDALDKIRVLYLTAPKQPLNKDGEAPSMDIRISFDKENKQLVIRDGGVGMTKDELSEHLGTLGTSGTKRFLEKFQEGGGANTNNLIGQFGVGFYSVFLVGDRVQVASKSDASDAQWVWESSGHGEFFLYEDPRGNTLGRGTEIRISVKPDAAEFLQADTIKKVVHQYSEFIDFPILVQEEVKTKAAKKSPLGEKASNDDEEEEEPQEVTELKWTTVNENRPIWTRPTTEVTEEEYNKFYKALTNDYQSPMYYSHFKVEGEVGFDSILFVPAEASMSIFAVEDAQYSNNIKLYVRRVFITDEFRDLLPRYLNFVKGIVDSNDLPLNVSREVLQESRILRVIKKKLVRKAINMFADIAAQDERLAAKKAAGENTSAGVASVAGTKLLTKPTYINFWTEFGKHIRLGVMDDTNNRGRLVKLLRYKSSKSDNEYIGLQTYIDRMQPGQKGIYYLSGDSILKIEQSPMLEDAKQRGVEVLYMTDAIDEYVVAQVPDFAGKKLINLAVEGVQLDDTNPHQRIIDKKRQEKYEPFFNRLQSLFGMGEVRKIVLTKRFTTEAFLLSSGENQMTARLANIMRGQAMGYDPVPPKADRVLEVNYRHPLVDEMFKRFSLDEDDSVAKDLAWVLYDTANLQSEFPVSDVAGYAKRVNRLLRSSVDIDPGEALLPADDNEYTIDEEELAEEEEAAAEEEEGNGHFEDDEGEEEGGIENVQVKDTEGGSQTQAAAEEAAPTNPPSEEKPGQSEEENADL